MVGLISGLPVLILVDRNCPGFPASLGAPERRNNRRDSIRSQQQQSTLLAGSGTALLAVGAAATVEAGAESEPSIPIISLYLVSAGYIGGELWKGAKG